MSFIPAIGNITWTNCSDSGLVTSGDSLEYGPAPVLLGQIKPFDVLVSAVGGSHCYDHVSNTGTCYGLLSCSYSLTDEGFYRASRARNVASLGCGVNDGIAGRTITEVYNDMLSYASQAQATGFSVILFTVQSHVLVDAWRIPLNVMIRGGAAAHNYVVADIGSDAQIGCTGCYSNPTYFQSDGVHFTEAGTAIQASYLKTALAAWGVN